MRGDLLPAGTSGGGGSLETAAQQPLPPSAEQQEAVWQALYALHAVYEVRGLQGIDMLSKAHMPCTLLQRVHEEFSH